VRLVLDWDGTVTEVDTLHHIQQKVDDREVSEPNEPREKKQRAGSASRRRCCFAGIWPCLRKGFSAQ